VEINRTTRVVGAVDIGGTKIAVGLVDSDGHILAKATCSTAPQAGFPDACRRIAATLSRQINAAGVRLAGVGIGCTGPVYPEDGRIGDVEFLPGWQGATPAAELSRQFGVPAVLENDADCAALAEAHWGVGRGRGQVIGVTVGTGIGAGIVLDGVLYRGAGQSHPELGHHIVDSSGPECYCGARGCWEVLASGSAVAAWAAANAPADYPHRAGLTAERIFELARAGDAFARQVVEREAHYLGLGCANLVTIFTPEILVLSGSVLRSASQLLPGIRTEVRKSCGLVPWQKTTLTTASLGPDTPLIGAAAAWFSRYTQNGE